MGKPNFGKFFGTIPVVLKKHSPEILTGIGIAGLFVTPVLAVKATPKALALIEEEKNKKWVDKLTPMETVKATWKCYIPAASSAVTSAVCIVGANTVHARRIAALTTAYTMSESTFREYKQKVLETIGEKKEDCVMFEDALYAMKGARGMTEAGAKEVFFEFNSLDVYPEKLYLTNGRTRVRVK